MANQEKQGKENKPIMTLQGSYSLNFSGDDSKGETGKASVVLEKEILRVEPHFQEPLAMKLTEIKAVNASDYKVHLTLPHEQVLVLDRLGYAYEDFFRELVKHRNQGLVQELLMAETVVGGSYPGRMQRVLAPETAPLESPVPCSLTLTETALLVLTTDELPLRIPFCLINSVSEDDYQLRLATDLGFQLVLSHLGRLHAPFVRDLNQALNQLSLWGQASLRQLLPEASPLLIRRVSTLMKDGKGISRRRLDEVDPNLWPQLEQQISLAGIEDTYRFLLEKSAPSSVFMGMKRGLMGDTGGHGIWLLFPLVPTKGEGTHQKLVVFEAGALQLGPQEEEPGPELPPQAARESIAEAGDSADTPDSPEDNLESTGRATYVFQVPLHEDSETALTRLNHWLLGVNFRREPLYLTEAQIKRPPYTRYQKSLEENTSLQALRRAFVARVFHRSKSQWVNELTTLMNQPDKEG